MPDQQHHDLHEPDSVAKTVALVKAEREAHPLMTMQAAAMTDHEIEQAFRLARALSASGLFKDVRSAEQAFAKLIVGRDLGLSPAQSLSLYAMEGKIEVPYPLLATFVRGRGMDYAIEWRLTTDDEHRWVEARDPEANDGVGQVTAARVTLTRGETIVGVSTWTVEDSETAGLTDNRGSKTSNHVKYPRSMFLARALSNACRWYVPEVLAGLPVYAEGELPRTQALGEGVGDGGAPGWGDMDLALAGDCERIIRLAEKRGHAGLANRASVQLQLRGQTPQAVHVWLREARAELDAMVPGSVPLVEEPAASDSSTSNEAAEPEPTRAEAVVGGIVETTLAAVDEVEAARADEEPLALRCTTCGHRDVYPPSAIKAETLGGESFAADCLGCGALTEHEPLVDGE